MEFFIPVLLRHEAMTRLYQ